MNLHHGWQWGRLIVWFTPWWVNVVIWIALLALVLTLNWAANRR